MKKIVVSFYNDSYLTINAEKFLVSDTGLEVLDDQGTLVFFARDFQGVWFEDSVVIEGDD